MSFQSDLYDHIANDQSINAIVGVNVYSDVADSAAVAPFIVYQVIATDGTTPLTGTRGICFPVIQISIWAATKTQAVSLAAIVDRSLDGIQVHGESGLSLGFSGQSGTFDAESRLFGEIMEYKGSCITN